LTVEGDLVVADRIGRIERLRGILVNAGAIVVERNFEGILDPQVSPPVSGTSIQRTLKSLIPEKPIACTGKVFRLSVRLPVLRFAQAGAMRGEPLRREATVGSALVSPEPKVTLPFELRKNVFQGEEQVPAMFPPKTYSMTRLSVGFSYTFDHSR
jgi:hypothetical protein